MRVVVLAYSHVGYLCLQSLLRCGDEVTSVFTHRDNPSETIWFDSVAELASAHSIPVFTPDDVNTPNWIERIRDDRPDALLSFYYRKLLCREILDLPTIGAFNMHGSWLPDYRGRCPVNWALIHGEPSTGVTLHEMIEKPDAGPIVGQRRIAIEPEDDAGTLSRKIGDEAVLLLEACLPGLRTGDFPRISQRAGEGSCFGGRTPEDGRIDWTRPAEEIHNLVRAVTHPWPGAFSSIGKRKLTLWETAVDRDTAGGLPGTVEGSDPPVVRCGEHRLVLKRWSVEAEKGPNEGQTSPGKELGAGIVLG